MDGDQTMASQIEQDKEVQMLDLINRVQMFQIASSKINQNLMQRKKNPVFNLQFTETFESKSNEDDEQHIDLVDDIKSEQNKDKELLNSPTDSKV